MSGTHIARLAETAFPLEVNSLFVDADGDLRRIDPRERPFGFRFDCLGLGFAGTTRVRQGEVWLCLAASLGPVPYTAESSQRRGDAFAILRAGLDGSHGRLAISRDRQIEVTREASLGEPLTAVSVVSAAARLVLEMRPLIRLVADYVGGTTKT